MGTVLWSGLGPPTKPGDVQVEGLGVVSVTQKNIDDAKTVGGNPEFEVRSSKSMGDKMPRYLLGLIR
jgi:hypothetical protein